MKQMEREALLDKTNRINVLFDFYRPLLTDKQQLFLQCYFHEDLSLGEIAAEFEISRQAVYEHIRRASAVLEEYENKLQLVAQQARLRALIEQITDVPLRTRFEQELDMNTQN